MLDTSIPADEVLTVEGATIDSTKWYEVNPNEWYLYFWISNPTVETQIYTVHADKAISKAQPGWGAKLDGNQDPPNTNGVGPNRDDYVFEGHAGTGISSGNLFICRYGLVSIYPHPFSSSLTIQYEISSKNRCSIEIYNAVGQSVVQLITQETNPGRYTLYWNGQDRNDKKMPDGVYFIRFKAGNVEQVRKAVLIK